MLRVAAASFVAAAALAIASSTAAQAATSAPTTGFDVSWPNCATTPPLDDFAVVGVNGGTATTTNPCLATQLAAAAGSPGVGHSAVDVYLNTANPDPASAAWWPRNDTTNRGRSVQTPYGHCTGGASRACSWVYGASLALDDLEIRGVTGAIGRWWLDVEADNTWSTSTTRNRAVLEGMTAQLTGAQQRVGIYALPGQFHDLIGTVPASSRLASLPSWIAGGTSEAAAMRLCSRTPLTGGRVLLAQWVDTTAALDRDVACALFSAAPKPKITGSLLAGARLTAKAGRWGPGTVRLTYRWTRDGEPIAKAVHRTFRLRAKDAGHRIAVVVTGTETGFSRVVRTSAAHRIHR